jgi:hypothetical protein
MSEPLDTPSPLKRRLGLVLALAMLALLVVGATVLERRAQPAAHIRVTQIRLPRPGLILVDILNSGSAPATIAQVQVDGAFWEFAIAPSAQLPHFGRATISIPYPWVQGEPLHFTLITSTGETFAGEL